VAVTYTTYARLAKPGDLDPGWGTIHNANYDLIDSWAPVRVFACTVTETPSSTLRVQVRGGNYKRVGVHQIFTASDVVLILAANTTVKVYCTASGITSAAAYPDSASHVPIATVVTGGSAITSIVDDRCPYLMTGFEITSGLDYANDVAAAVGGVKIGELYHSSGTVKIRRT
jgi:hypothetical protein